MVENRVQEIIRRLDDETSKMWLTTPEEATKLKRMKGTLDDRLLEIVYFESESREMVDYLHVLNMTAKNSNESLEGVKLITKNILDFKAAKWPGHYHVNKTVGLLKECVLALDAVKTTEDYVALVEALKQYINILSWWMDSQIPFSEFSLLYDWIALGSDATIPEDKTRGE